jgi:acyl-CoA reductase-like NAD-dependent aldehyde dehydrogenase
MANGCDRGAFVAPTIFAACADDMVIVREEIFGPVMAVLPFTDEADVIARANATEFGLAGAVFTRISPAPTASSRSRRRHLLDQHLQHHADRAAVRRGQAIGPGP